MRIWIRIKCCLLKPNISSKFAKIFYLMYLQFKLTYSAHLYICVWVSYLCCERDWKYEMQQMCLLK